MTGKTDEAIEAHHFFGKKDIMKAVWKDVVIAESDDTVVVEGNH